MAATQALPGFGAILKEAISGIFSDGKGVLLFAGGLTVLFGALWTFIDFSGRDVGNGATVATELVFGIVALQWHRCYLLGLDKAKELKKQAKSLMIGYLLRAAFYYIVIGVLALGVGLPLVFADFMSGFGVPAAVAITVVPIIFILILFSARLLLIFPAWAAVDFMTWRGAWR
ncbi:MAG: hypothetical protein CMM46_09710 [Rhodospirillaceae bacterium]|nr:hypothetical protein [Rhodospirillaceae bacterium]